MVKWALKAIAHTYGCVVNIEKKFILAIGLNMSLKKEKIFQPLIEYLMNSQIQNY